MAFTYSEKRRPSWKDLGWAVVVNTLIAVVLNIIFQAKAFWIYLIVSQCIGLSISTLCRFSLMLLKPETNLSLVIILTAAIVSGGLVGGLVGGLLTGVELVSFTAPSVHTLRIIIMSLLIGGAISFFFLSRGKIAETQHQLQQERIQRLTSEKNAAQTQLKMLQAQIEPHFLFNTLSNIQSLLETDPPAGKKMLKDLTRYLRASLAETRAQWTTLGGEMELITAYLDLFKVRMGDRLQVCIHMDEALKSARFAPMLLQPLVENAVLHGLEEMIDGGTVAIRAEQENTILRVVVTDTGKGFAPGASKGMGLVNIHDRLKALYGPQGRLIITENQPTGVKAVIEVPYAVNH